MCHPKNAESVMAARQQQVLELELKGWNQEEIAKHLKVSQATISRDISAINKQRHLTMVPNVKVLRERDLQKLELIERSAWAGWDRSMQPDTSNDGNTKTPVGDPRFLAQIYKCIALRRSMLALDVPERKEEPKRLIDCDDEEFKEKMAEIERMFADPPPDEESSDESEASDEVEIAVDSPPESDAPGESENGVAEEANANEEERPRSSKVWGPKRDGQEYPPSGPSGQDPRSSKDRRDGGGRQSSG